MKIVERPSFPVLGRARRRPDGTREIEYETADGRRFLCIPNPAAPEQGKWFELDEEVQLP